MNEPVFEGTAEQQELATQVFQLMCAQGTFYANDTPIKQSLAHLADFLASRYQRAPEQMMQAIDAALSANSKVFLREQHEADVIYATTRLGLSEVPLQDSLHTLKERLYQPENPLPVDDISVVVSTSRPALTTVEPVYISDYWQTQAGLTPITPSDGDLLDVPDDLQDDIHSISTEPLPPVSSLAERVDLPLPPLDTFPEPAEPTPDPDTILASPDDLLKDAITIPHELESTPLSFAEEGEEEPSAEAEAAEQVVEPVEAADTAPSLADTPGLANTSALAPAEALLTLDDGATIDLSQPVETILSEHRDLLIDKLTTAVDQDPLRRIVRFGTRFYAEVDLVSLGKNDLRRIREDIIEAGEPLLDTTIIADLYYHSQRQSDYEGFRFSLNYRLSREKDFEFVGIPNAYLWWVKGLPAIGTKRIKASEMAQFTSYLVEGYDDSLDQQDAQAGEPVTSVTHFLTFFEWAHGMLSLDAALAALLPGALLPDQRSAVLRFDSPQHYSSHLVEMRFPTANRGGWVQGLEDFFQEHLVAGAQITLERTEEPHVFTLTYEETSGEVDRILVLDEKKNKFGFTDMEYYALVDSEMLLSQTQYGRLKNLKSLPTNDRRKGDMVLQHIFKVMGDQIGTRTEPLYQANLDTLYVAYNVLRPASRSFLKSLLDSSDLYEEDQATTALYTYMPEPEPEDENEEDESIIQWDYDDDE